jgi:hypothetical protein
MIMKNYAVIENDIVINIVVGDNEWADAQTLTLVELTESDAVFIGGKYLDGIFYKTKPYPSWVESGDGWIPPISKPRNTENSSWMWNESTLSWISVNMDASSMRIEEPNDEFAD